MAVIFLTSEFEVEVRPASKLEVKPKLLDYVMILSTETFCSAHGVFPAALSNHSQCINQFARVYQGANARKACCCESDVCTAVGYSHEGNMRLPFNQSDCVEFLQVLGIAEAAKRKEMALNHLRYHVALAFSSRAQGERQ